MYVSVTLVRVLELAVGQELPAVKIRLREKSREKWVQLLISCLLYFLFTSFRCCWLFSAMPYHRNLTDKQSSCHSKKEDVTQNNAMNDWALRAMIVSMVASRPGSSHLYFRAGPPQTILTCCHPALTRNETRVCWLVACLTSQQQASVSQGRICSDNSPFCHTEIEVADPTFYLTQSQYTDIGPTSPSTDPITLGAWQGSHWSANFQVTGMIRPRKKSRRQRDSNSWGGHLNH